MCKYIVNMFKYLSCMTYFSSSINTKMKYFTRNQSINKIYFNLSIFLDIKLTTFIDRVYIKYASSRIADDYQSEVLEFTDINQVISDYTYA